MFNEQFFTSPTGIFLMLLYLFWVIPWKGFALWRAARNKHTRWFVVLLIVNTLALLEIIYIFYFSGKKKIKLPFMK